jgi:hypothetical protein
MLLLCKARKKIGITIPQRQTFKTEIVLLRVETYEVLYFSYIWYRLYWVFVCKLLRTSDSAVINSGEPNTLSGYKQKLIYHSLQTTLAAVIENIRERYEKKYVYGEMFIRPVQKK